MMTSRMTFPAPCLSGEGCGLFPSLRCLTQRGSPVAMQDTIEPAWHLSAHWHGRQYLGWRSGHLLLHGSSLVLSGAPEIITHARHDPSVFTQWGCDTQTCA